ncbi:class I SAM-dependent methyltransferase [Natronogracilivirga saccharolytica]|uniref:Class I SAM-dependent methyltransferase n=1 Tax=Natronogracilivirga saccharolytica TaxID=2812953 RepID=A0A8J7S6Q4_9BACT|nr:class I SAM-dependent methyltransferase [Natronogracilivirga saccharolytica]MBP3191273.1 class I SAM-dependent methyltransferase [Natronogracilivirga saccharolytica]
MSAYNRFREKHYHTALASLTGRVLEIGFGDGTSLLRYAQADEVFGLEKKRKKIQAAGSLLKKNHRGDIRLVEGVAEQLPFESCHFDAVTCSFTLCSVNSREQTVSEILRVLKPGGRLILLEHTLSHNGFFRILQKVLARPLSKISGNCHLDNEPLRVIDTEKFQIISTAYFPFYLEPPLFIEAVKKG